MHELNISTHGIIIFGKFTLQLKLTFFMSLLQSKLLIFLQNHSAISSINLLSNYSIYIPTNNRANGRIHIKHLVKLYSHSLTHNSCSYTQFFHLHAKVITLFGYFLFTKPQRHHHRHHRQQLRNSCLKVYAIQLFKKKENKHVIL